MTQLDFIQRYDLTTGNSPLRKRVAVALKRAVLIIANEANDAPNHPVRAELARILASPIKQDVSFSPAYNLAITSFSEFLAFAGDLLQVEVNGVMVPVINDLANDDDVLTGVLAFWDLAAKVAGLKPPTPETPV